VTDSSTAPQRPGRPRSPEVEERIVQAATELILESGVARMTIDDVAAAAHTSKTSIYSRFSSKDDLFDRCVSRLTEQHLSALLGVDSGATTGDAAAALERLLAVTSPRGAGVQRQWRLRTNTCEPGTPATSSLPADCRKRKPTSFCAPVWRADNFRRSWPSHPRSSRMRKRPIGQRATNVSVAAGSSPPAPLRLGSRAPAGMLSGTPSS
jgi:AcrR family transcriptional regulator